MNAPLLTFDDGPSESTAEILDLLAAHRVTAIFYVTGLRTTQRPDLVARAAAQGHEIGNHTWDHVRLTGYTDADVTQKLRQTNEAIEAILGKPPALFRGPWFDVDDRVLRLAAGLGLSHMWADVDTCDYSDLAEHDAEFVANAIRASDPGQIVLLHDGTGDEMGGEVNPPRPKTVEALRLALPECADRWQT
jgi:peptidoglycan/xylan/chitin deacetylase (PgdA/CDA1 family)